MLIHVILLLAICILGMFIYRRGVSKRKNKQFIFWALFLVFLVQACRAQTVGLDTQNYVRGFIVLDQNLEGSYYSWTAFSWEPLWKLLNYFVGLFTDNPQWLLAVSSAFILTGIGVFVYYNCKDNESSFWPIFFFMTLAILYPMSTYLLRQFCAVGLLANIYTLLRNGKTPKKFFLSILFILIATGFHKSAILVGIIILLVSVWPIVSKKVIWAALVLQIVVPYIYTYLVNIFVQIFPQYSLYLTAYEGEEIRAYSVVMIALRAICCLLVILKFDPRRPENILLYKLCLLNAIVSIFVMLQTKTIMAQRLGNYFEIFLILLIPEIMHKLTKKRLLYFGVFAFSVAFFMFELSTGARGIVPYSFFWE